MDKQHTLQTPHTFQLWLYEAEPGRTPAVTLRDVESGECCDFAEPSAMLRHLETRLLGLFSAEATPLSSPNSPLRL